MQKTPDGMNAGPQASVFSLLLSSLPRSRFELLSAFVGLQLERVNDAV
jgi:hypothetical protein